MNEIRENGIRIYTGEIDEEDDSSDIRDLRVSDCFPHTTTTLLTTALLYTLCVCVCTCAYVCAFRNLFLSQLLAATLCWR